MKIVQIYFTKFNKITIITVVGTNYQYPSIFSVFFSFLLDPAPRGKLNADPCGSVSTALLLYIQTTKTVVTCSIPSPQMMAMRAPTEDSACTQAFTSLYQALHRQFRKIGYSTRKHHVQCTYKKVKAKNSTEDFFLCKKKL